MAYSNSADCATLGIVTNPSRRYPARAITVVRGCGLAIQAIVFSGTPLIRVYPLEPIGHGGLPCDYAAVLTDLSGFVVAATCYPPAIDRVVNSW